MFILAILVFPLKLSKPTFYLYPIISELYIMIYKYSTVLSKFPYHDILSIYLSKRFVYLPLVGSPPSLNHIFNLYFT